MSLYRPENGTFLRAASKARMRSASVVLEPGHDAGQHEPSDHMVPLGVPSPRSPPTSSGVRVQRLALGVDSIRHRPGPVRRAPRDHAGALQEGLTSGSEE